MDYVTLGRSGLRVSRIGLGGFAFGDPAWQGWVLSAERSRPIIQRAIELGINFIDTADMYSDGASETIIGEVWPDCCRRESIVLATKAYYPTGPSPNEQGLSRKHLFAAIDASLKRLRTDYVDLYQIHRLDPVTPLEETLRALDDIVASGRARYVGVSNCPAWQLMKILAICEANGWTRPISVQNHYNLAYREEEREMVHLCLDQGVGLVPWSPLARGFLAGKLDRSGAGSSLRSSEDPYIRAYFSASHDHDVLDAARACAARHGASPAQVALAWLCGKAAVAAPVIGASRVEHVTAAVEALSLTLDAGDVEALEAPYRPHPVLLHL